MRLSGCDTCTLARRSARASVSANTTGANMVFALTEARALRLAKVDVSHPDNRMEVLTGPTASGPWSSVFEFTGRSQNQALGSQTFAAPADAPLLTGFVQVAVHDTYGATVFVESIVLEGAVFERTANPFHPSVGK